MEPTQEMLSTDTFMDTSEWANFSDGGNHSSISTGLMFNQTFTGRPQDDFVLSNFQNNTKRVIDIPQGILISVYFLRCVWTILSLFGNILTCVAVYRYESLKTTTNYLICSLAISDCVSVFLTPAAIIQHVFHTSDFYIPLCLFEKAVSMICLGGNYFNILWIAIDRYVYIAYPLRYPFFVTHKRSFFLIKFTWLNLLVQSPLIFAFGNKMESHVPCRYVFILKDSVYQYLLLYFLIMLVLTIGFHIAIGRIAHRQSVAIAAMNNPYDTLEASSIRSQKKIAKMMSMVLGVFLLTALPEFILSLVMKNTPSVTTASIEMFTNLIYWMNTWLNPLIYAWKSVHFRVAFRKILFRSFRCSEQIHPIQPAPVGADM